MTGPTPEPVDHPRIDRFGAYIALYDVTPDDVTLSDEGRLCIGGVWIHTPMSPSLGERYVDTLAVLVRAVELVQAQAEAAA